MSDSFIKKYWDKIRRAFGSTDSAGDLDELGLEPSPKERRREVRFDLPGAGPLNLSLEYNKEFCEIENLSSQGLGFRAPESFSMEQLGVEVQTVILVENAIHPVTLLPKYCRDGLVGCRVSKASTEWKKASEEYIEPLRVGRALREIHPEFLRREDDGFQIRWFQGLAGCDLFVWYGENEMIRKIQFFYFSAIVEWTENHQLRTGRLQEGIGFDNRLVTIEADLYGFSTVLDDALLEKVQRILSASLVPKEIQRYFTKPSSVD